MKYLNKVTGAVIDSPCVISGGDWVVASGVKPAAEPSSPDEAVEVDPADMVNSPDLSTINLAQLSVAELKELAGRLGIDLHGATKKADIIEYLLSA